MNSTLVLGPEDDLSSLVGILRWFRTPRPPDDPVALDDAELNTCFNAADRHVATGRAEQAAAIGPSLASGRRSELTFAELTEQAAKVAGILRALEVRAGQTVLIDVPTSLERLVSMLAVARLGASYVLDDASAVSWVQAAITSEPLAHERCVVLAQAKDPTGRAGRVAPAAPEGSFDYRALLRSSAVQPAECVSVSGRSALRRDAGGVLCNNAGHLIGLVRAGLARARRPEAATSPISLSPSELAEHPCLMLAPLLLGHTVSLPEEQSTERVNQRD